jgi:hypothetical protein
MNHDKFYNSVEDCKWLRETALRGYTVPEFKSFTFAGNEDCPLAIRFYAVTDPDIDEAYIEWTLRENPVSNLSEYVITV